MRVLALSISGAERRNLLEIKQRENGKKGTLWAPESTKGKEKDKSAYHSFRTRNNYLLFFKEQIIAVILIGSQSLTIIPFLNYTLAVQF